MKVKIAAFTIFIVIILSVVANTVILGKQIDDLSAEVKKIEIGAGAYQKTSALLEDFRQKESFMSLTVSHDDLTTIGECIVEMQAYLSQEDYQNAEVEKNRLEYFLKHLKRLSGFNIDAIIKTPSYLRNMLLLA